TVSSRRMYQATPAGADARPHQRRSSLDARADRRLADPGIRLTFYVCNQVNAFSSDPVISHSTRRPDFPISRLPDWVRLPNVFPRSLQDPTQVQVYRS